MGNDVQTTNLTFNNVHLIQFIIDVNISFLQLFNTDIRPDTAASLFLSRSIITGLLASKKLNAFENIIITRINRKVNKH